jgi:hypothetical protein
MIHTFGLIPTYFKIFLFEGARAGNGDGHGYGLDFGHSNGDGHGHGHRDGQLLR